MEKINIRGRETELLREVLEAGNCPADVVSGSYCHKPDQNNDEIIFHINNGHKSLDQDHAYLGFGFDVYMDRKILGWYAEQAFYINHRKDNLLSAIRQMEDVFFDKTADKGFRHLIFKDVKLKQIDPDGSMANGNLLSGYARMPEKLGKGEDFYEKGFFSRKVPATGNYVFDLNFYGFSGAMFEQEVTSIFSGNAEHRNVNHHNLDTVLKSQKILEKNFQKHGARYEITGFALLQEKGHQVESILKDLLKEKGSVRTHDGYTDTLTLPGKLSIKAGPRGITTRIPLGNKVKWVNDHIVIKQEFPDSIVNVLPGRKISSLFEHPILGDKKITGVKYKNGTLSVGVALEWQKLDWDDDKWKN